MKKSSGKDGGGAKRASTRTVVVSRAMRTIDAETRFEVSNKRLAMLENDNYLEEAEQEEAYGGGEGGGGGGNDGDRTSSAPVLPKAKKSKLNTSGLSKWALRRNKPLERIIHEQGYSLQQEVSDDLFASDRSAIVIRCGRYPNILSVNAGPSLIPPRKLCGVCGLTGIYSCRRCGAKSCCIKCSTVHREEQCLKSGIM